MRRSLSAVATVLAALSLAACGRTVSEADCKKIGDNLEEVWNVEAGKVAPADAASAAKAAAVIKAEGAKVQNDWAEQCRKELLGRRVDPKEIDCLESAKTADDVNHCAD